MRDILKVGLIAFVAAFAGALLAVMVVGGNGQSPAIPTAVGGYTEGDWDSAGGYKVDGTTIIDGSGQFPNDLTFNGGSGAVNITTTNAATSSLTVGCINMYATSTLTAGKVTLSPTLTASGTRVISWDYGTCP
jgi:hypothetical protein